jgi:hypothetical protein
MCCRLGVLLRMTPRTGLGFYTFFRFGESWLGVFVDNAVGQLLPGTQRLEQNTKRANELVAKLRYFLSTETSQAYHSERRQSDSIAASTTWCENRGLLAELGVWGRE